MSKKRLWGYIKTLQYKKGPFQCTERNIGNKGTLVHVALVGNIFAHF